MAQHRLELEVPDTLSKCIFRIMDLSSYNPDITVKCPRLQISIPGFSNSVFIDNITTGFVLNLTACDLKIQKVNCGKDFNDLPDGIYVIRYSISPNETVFVEYNFLRTTKALNKIKSIYCELDLEDCVASAEKKKRLQEIRLIQDYLTAAKADVEYCRSSHKGLELYKKASQMLDKFNCQGCHK